MIFLFLVSAFFLSACGPNKSQIEPVKIKKGAIVGGTEVDPSKTDTSYIVSLNGGCAGSIIGAKWILTAAHCKSLFKSKITGGSINLRDPRRIQLKVLRSYVHPEYDTPESSHDWALLELTKEIDFEKTPQLGMITLASSDFEENGGLDEGIMATVLGWGVTRENGSQPSVMREVDLPLVSRERANLPSAYDGSIDETMIAAGYEQGGKDSCQGDSGGPLIIRDGASQTLIGVVSFGEGCARENKYGIYSNVSYANKWIHSIIDKE